MKIVLAAAAIYALLSPAVTLAEDWYPSKFGADDTLGAANSLSPEGVLAAVKLVKTGKVYRLGVETGSTSPAYPPRNYKITILQLDDGTGTPSGSNLLTGNDDLLQTWVGIGSQIDGLGHIGINHVYYNGVPAKDFVKVPGLTKFSISDIPPIVTRGVLLDFVGLKGKGMLPAGTALNSADIKAAASAQGVTINKGDVVILHTGWLAMATQDPAAFIKGEPGLGVEGAQYLAGIGVVAVGADTFAVEVMPHETVGQAFPVHQELIPKNGIYILENMDTRELIKDHAYEFLFVLGQPRLVGAVQAIINPVAIR
ncbi:MAG: cyclase family protein [Gammaproteobacteria bacterium]|nr:cyclase family protein [Gammaproteobacteria bacterium]